MLNKISKQFRLNGLRKPALLTVIGRFFMPLYLMLAIPATVFAELTLPPPPPIDPNFDVTVSNASVVEGGDKCHYPVKALIKISFSL